MSVRLYIGNLPKELDRQELAAVFAEAGDSVSTKVITDRKTGKCRGFGFVTVKTDEEADQIIDKFNGYVFKDTAIKIEKALPRTKGKNGEESPSEESSELPIQQSAPSNGAGPAKSNNRRKNNSKSKRGGVGASNVDSVEGVQPDPRWAQELEKLKQLLAAQTTAP